ncbi:TetR/AcrR family transcriptional regulator [Actinophytocola glycyrrhizae]|uniref:TetR/AcrR family transcriptional regulator n=1 Tax=Actinophytocola glycyrrhizae TaxID=2044873 RepID=A0ABV9RZC8_9PSEU
MSRLTRAETQERNRTRVLAAARDEFAERGYRETKIDVVAERAELTRGAVYSNFPGKRALYFAVLADLAERAPAAAPAPAPGRTTGDALAALARTWLARLPTSAETARLGMDVLPEVMADETIRQSYAQLMALDAVLLGLALERLRPDGRLVRVAETVLTALHGASQLAAAAPGFVEPFNVVSACEQLAYLDVEDGWPELPFTTQVRAVDAAWSPPAAWDSVRAQDFTPAEDGIVAVLGLHRAAAVEHAVRAAPPDAAVTAVLVSGSPREQIPLARLAVAELTGCLRQAFPEYAWPRLRVACDGTGALAATAGVPAVSDTTEVAIRIAGGRVVSRAEGYGACHVVTTAQDRAARSFRE